MSTFYSETLESPDRSDLCPGRVSVHKEGERRERGKEDEWGLRNNSGKNGTAQRAVNTTP